MKASHTTTSVCIFVFLLSVGSAMLMPASVVHAADMSTWIKGASITPDSSTQFSSASFEQSLVKLKTTNANSVTFVIPLTQSSLTSTDIGPAANTPTDASLVTAIQEAHALGLAVTLKPHLDPATGDWRAYINPVGAGNRSAWFAAYDAQILHYAALAQANHVEMIVVGTELIDMSSDSVSSTNTANWLSLISKVRAIYSGKLTYAANWGGTANWNSPTEWSDEKDNIKFWSALDYAGIDAYYPLGTTSSSNSIPALLADWNTAVGSSINTFAQSVGKPILFTEVGYRSTTGDHGNSDDYSYSNGYDGTEQANDYAALFQYWSTNPYIAGMSLWQWDPSPTAGGAGDLNYTPQNKPAQAVMTAWFGGTSVPYAAPAVGISAATATTTSALNQPISLTAQVTNTGGSVSGGIIDLEVYNAAGTQVYQSFAQNQSLGPAVVPYTVSWTPPSAGVYTVKVGAFSGDWSTNYAWDNQAETITVGAAARVTPSVPAAFTAVVASTTATLNQPVSLTAMVTDTGGAANALVDIEVYNSAGKQVFQNFMDNQSFAANQTKLFTVSWTPSVYDTYHVSVGVFALGWASNYVWLSTAQTVVVSPASVTVPVPVIPVAPIATSSTPVATSTPVVQTATSTSPTATTTQSIPTSTPAIIDVWWPTTSSVIGGTLPFKAMVENMSVNAYTMYWQVDGGSLNSMYISNTDYPHYEQEVTVSGWNWRGAGPYQITFIAKDSSGTTIASQVIPVTISS